jgi:hypothetical protein
LDELLEGLVFAKAAADWNADFFISYLEGLQTPAGQMRELDILTVDGAVALLGLFLRSREQCVVPGKRPLPAWDSLSPWWFYRVGAWAVPRQHSEDPYHAHPEKLKLRDRVQAVVLPYGTGSSTSAESGQAASLLSAPGLACDDPLQPRISALRIT